MDKPSFRLPPGSLSPRGLAAQIAAVLALDMPVPSAPHQIGRGKRTIHSLYARIGTSRYEPHQGERECARRRRQRESEG